MYVFVPNFFYVGVNFLSEFGLVVVVEIILICYFCFNHFSKMVPSFECIEGSLI